MNGSEAYYARDSEKGVKYTVHIGNSIPINYLFFFSPDSLPSPY